MTIALEKALMESGYKYWNLSKKARDCLRKFGRKYPNLSYGTNFKGWLLEDGRQSTNSYGNGAAMRISSIGWIATDLKQVKKNESNCNKCVSLPHRGYKRSRSNCIVYLFVKDTFNKTGYRHHYCQLE